MSGSEPNNGAKPKCKAKKIRHVWMGVRTVLYLRLRSRPGVLAPNLIAWAVDVTLCVTM